MQSCDKDPRPQKSWPRYRGDVSDRASGRWIWLNLYLPFGFVPMGSTQVSNYNFKSVGDVLHRWLIHRIWFLNVTWYGNVAGHEKHFWAIWCSFNVNFLFVHPVNYKTSRRPQCQVTYVFCGTVCCIGSCACNYCNTCFNIRTHENIQTLWASLHQGQTQDPVNKCGHIWKHAPTIDEKQGYGTCGGATRSAFLKRANQPYFSISCETPQSYSMVMFFAKLS